MRSASDSTEGLPHAGTAATASNFTDGEMPCRDRNCRTAETMSWTSVNAASASASRSSARCSGQAATEIDAPIPNRCQISSVTNGMIGCRSRSVRSSTHARTFAASCRSAPSASRRPFCISSPQSQNSDQRNRNTSCAASEN